nr:ketoacyl-CoA synthase 2 [Pelargonium x hortorum]
MIMLLCVLSMIMSYVLFVVLSKRREQECFVLDYECFKPSDERIVSTQLFQHLFIDKFKNRDIELRKFLAKATLNADISNRSYAPRTVFNNEPANPTLADSIFELEEFFLDTIQKLFHRSGISPKDIDVMVVNVSLLTPAPSLAARIINHYKLRDDIKVFNLTGMGCSANLISIDIVRNIFKCHKNMCALVVSTESLGPSWYEGKDKSMLLSNCLFRSGGCILALTNNPALKHKAMFKLMFLTRIHHGARDDAYDCCKQAEDEEGREGFFLGRGLPKAANIALEENLRTITPKIISMRELIRYIVNSKLRRSSDTTKINFKNIVDHFSIHPGGRAVLNGVQKSLELSDYDIEPSKMTLRRFGNMSSPSIWYIMGYLEAKKRLRKGDKVLMISFGSGFKCNSCVWEVLRDLGSGNVWKECINEYPPKAKDPLYSFVENYFKELHDDTLTSTGK